jgi:uncharacterized protein YndB with AHSA1/START domain
MATLQLERLHFEIPINAPVQRVYSTMLDQQQYQQWTAAFNPSSHYKGTWETSSTMHFVGIDKDGNEEGMVSVVRENIPNKFLSVEHLGMLKGGKEITTGPEVEGWAGALENYTFRGEGGKTVVLVDMDAHPEFTAYFRETWPKALALLKQLCEA